MDKPTLEELKEYAKEYGYHLMPNPKYIKKLPCTCGRKRLEIWTGKDGYFWRCPQCGKQGPAKATERKASRAWNEKIAMETQK